MLKQRIDMTAEAGAAKSLAMPQLPGEKGRIGRFVQMQHPKTGVVTNQRETDVAAHAIAR